MNFKSFVLALAAGIATFLIVGAGVATLVQPWIEFSVFVGIPVGLVAGAIAAVLVALGLGDAAPVERRRLAATFGAFAVGFLIVLVAGSVATLGLTLSMLVGVVVGTIAALGTYLREPKVARPDVQA